MDRAAYERMVTLISGCLRGLPKEMHCGELSHSRMGWDSDVELTGMLIEKLERRDLARPSEDGVSVMPHPTVRTGRCHRQPRS